MLRVMLFLRSNDPYLKSILTMDLYNVYVPRVFSLGTLAEDT